MFKGCIEFKKYFKSTQIKYSKNDFNGVFNLNLNSKQIKNS